MGSTKSEARNAKQIQNMRIQTNYNVPKREWNGYGVLDLPSLGFLFDLVGFGFDASNFEFGLSGLFRISIFGFRILVVGALTQSTLLWFC
jgi:hypothetical protein